MVKRHALEPLKATVDLERLGELDHTRHVSAEIGEVAVGDTAHEARHRCVSGC